MQQWSFKQPTQSGFYWYSDGKHMAVGYVRFLDKSLQYQRQTIAEVEMLNGAGPWEKMRIEDCGGCWIGPLEEPDA